MRNRLTAFVLASALTFGAAEAAPSFGSSSQRLGGGAAAHEGDAPTLIEIVLGLVGFDFAATIEPVAGERFGDRAGKAKECEQSKKTEVAKAEPKESGGATTAKARPKSGEPVYLAF